MTDAAGAIWKTRRQVLKSMLGAGAGLVAPLILTLPQAARAARGGTSSATGPSEPQFLKGLYDVTRFGATGDGKTLDTPAINKAIEAAAAAGGGTVRFPAGSYRCYSIRLKSNITLYLDHGAAIVAAEPEGGRGYDPPEPNPWDAYQDFGHSHWHNSLMWGEGIQNVSILGPGLIWGKGLTRGPEEKGPGAGDKSIALKNCHNVTIRDVSILHGGHFGILATGVDNLTIDNVIIDTNRDGMDIDCCRNVRVSNCSVNSPWDDGICPKSSYALGYARSTQDVTISDCFVTGGLEEGSLLDGTFKRIPPGPRPNRTGRIKCGTESNGGFQNITISDCVFHDCQGLALETVDGALLEDITISNITMREITSVPIFMRLGSRMRGPAGAAVGKLRRVNISNLEVSDTAAPYASIISGIPGYAIEDIKLSNIFVLHQGGGTKADATLEPREKESSYPEPKMFGPLPAYGFFIRHVNGIEVSNVEVRYEKEDLRPPFVLHDVKGADFLRVKAEHAQDVPTFVLRDTEDFNLYSSRPLPDTHLERAENQKL